MKRAVASTCEVARTAADGRGASLLIPQTGMAAEITARAYANLPTRGA